MRFSDDTSPNGIARFKTVHRGTSLSSRSDVVKEAEANIDLHCHLRPEFSQAVFNDSHRLACFMSSAQVSAADPLDG
jgi:hypothetical protein